jgi:nitrate/nitrite transporter NarK
VAFLGGAVVDRLGTRRMSIVADVASMLCVAAIPLLYTRRAPAFWQLLALVFLPGGA